MIEILINEDHLKFVRNYAEKQTIGGFSNLDKDDLKKASRYEYQLTGVVGEVAWNLYRYGSIDKLKDLLDYKFKNLRPQGKGDDGFDDSITYNDKSRYVDIKTTHVADIGKIKYLNLVIPPREYHQRMIYVCAFSVGKDRNIVDKVILAGWKFNEEIIKKWAYDNSKWCVPVSDLTDMKELDVYLKNVPII